jgi:hypothetical protein
MRDTVRTKAIFVTQNVDCSRNRLQMTQMSHCEISPKPWDLSVASWVCIHTVGWFGRNRPEIVLVGQNCLIGSLDNKYLSLTDALNMHVHVHVQARPAALRLLRLAGLRQPWTVLRQFPPVGSSVRKLPYVTRHFRAFHVRYK